MDIFKGFIEKFIFLDSTRSSLWITIRYAFVAGTGFFSTILLTRLLVPEVYGAFQYYLALIAFFSFLTLPGLNLAALKSVAEGNPSVMFQAIVYSFCCGGLIIPSVLLWEFFMVEKMMVSFPWLLFICLLSVPFYAFNTWYVFYEGQQNFFASALRAMLVATVTVVTLVILAFFQSSPAVLLSGYFLSGSIVAFIFCIEIYFLVKKTKINASLDLKYGYKATFQKFITSLSETLPLLLIGSFYGTVEVATFQIAFYIYLSFSGYLSALSSMLLPKFFLGYHLRGGRLVIQQGIIGILVGITIIFISFIIFPVLFHDSYQEGRYILLLLTPFACLLPIRNYLATYLSAKEPGYMTIIVLIANSIAASVFIFNLEKGFIVSGVSYLGTVSLILLVLLTHRYLRFSKAD